MKNENYYYSVHECCIDEDMEVTACDVDTCENCDSCDVCEDCLHCDGIGIFCDACINHRK